MTGELISLFDQHARSKSATGQRPSDRAPCARRAGRRRRTRPPITGCPAQIVARIAPHTEADPVAILTQLLVCCGALIGRGAHFQVEATRHHPNEFAILIGDSSKARKGASFDHVAKLMSEADPAFPARHVDRPIEWRGVDLDAARPCRAGPRQP